MKIKLNKEQYVLLLRRSGYKKNIAVDVLDVKNAYLEQQIIENPESPKDAVARVVYNMLDKMVSDYKRNKLRSK